MKGIDVIAWQTISMQSFQKKGKRCEKAVLCDHCDNYILDSYLYHIHVINGNG